jgi:hypothetical protein
MMLDPEAVAFDRSEAGRGPLPARWDHFELAGVSELAKVPGYLPIRASEPVRQIRPAAAAQSAASGPGSGDDAPAQPGTSRQACVGVNGHGGHLRGVGRAIAAAFRQLV